MPGYKIGPILEPKEAPWPGLWEQNLQAIDDGHEHQWECVLIPPAPARRLEQVVRCAACHVPRCGHSDDEDPCMMRRHHPWQHVLLSGKSFPVGSSG